MLETPHVVVGAAIGVSITNPILAIPLALASHIVLDRIPHWNPHFYTETEEKGKPGRESTIFALADITIALVLGLFIASQFLPNTSQAILIVFTSLAAVLPDLVKSPFYYLGIRNGIMKRWVDFERSLQVETSFIPGVISQLLIIVAGLYWIFS